jgi:hypothetical protein
MADKIILITAKQVTTGSYPYLPKQVDVVSPEVVTEITDTVIVANNASYTIKQANVPGTTVAGNYSSSTLNVSTSADINLNVVVTNMGEESIPNLSKFTRLQDFYLATDTISVSYLSTKNEVLTNNDIATTTTIFNRVFQSIPVTQASYKVFFVNKNITDPALLTERSVKHVYKNFLDLIGKVDTLSFVYSKNLVELKNIYETPKFEYLKSVSESVVLDNPIVTTVTFNRQILDIVSPTDDFLGEANLDDDQVAYIGKNTVSWIASAELRSLLLRTVKQDLVFYTDTYSSKTGKSLSDTLTKSDVVSNLVDKTIRSNYTADDIKTSFTTKVLQDTNNTVSLVQAAVGKQLYNLGQVDDATTVSAEKLLSSTFSNTDTLLFEWKAYTTFSNLVQKQDLLSSVFGKHTLDSGSTETIVSMQSTKNILQAPIASSDILSTVYSGARLFIDNINYSQHLKVNISKILNTIYSINTAFSFSYAKPFSDVHYNTDSAVYKVKKRTQDSITGSDEIVEALLYTLRRVLETAYTTSSGYLNNQNYFADNFIEPGYVGTNTYFS